MTCLRHLGKRDTRTRMLRVQSFAPTQKALRKWSPQHKENSPPQKNYFELTRRLFSRICNILFTVTWPLRYKRSVRQRLGSFRWHSVSSSLRLKVTANFNVTAVKSARQRLEVAVRSKRSQNCEHMSRNSLWFSCDLDQAHTRLLVRARIEWNGHYEGSRHLRPSWIWLLISGTV